MAGLRDVGWRSLELERERLLKEGAKPGLADRNSALALLVALHDAVGPRAIGDAINQLDAEDKRLRLNRVRYYRFAELKKALLETLQDDARTKAVSDLIP